MSDDLEILPNEEGPPPPEGVYARIAQEAKLEVVVRVVAVDLACELTGVTKENVVDIARQISEFMLTGAVQKPKRGAALAVVKSDADA